MRKKRGWRAVVVVLSLVLAGVGAGLGCKDEAPATGSEDTRAAASPPAKALTVSADSKGLLFRYYDPDARTMKTARSVDAVPEVARARVIVHDEKALLDYHAGQPLTVADLRTPNPDGTYPTELVDPYAYGSDLPSAPKHEPTPAAQPAGGTGDKAATVAGVGPDDVILFATDWCPHCRHARQYLESKGVDFTERNVEKDPKARPLLQKLGRAAGVDPALLTSVPILWVKGHLVLGFDQQRVAQLLGH